MRQYDVVIAGGAMAGATLALAIEHLSKAALRIAVVEPFKAQSDSHPGLTRALSPYHTEPLIFCATYSFGQSSSLLLRQLNISMFLIVLMQG